MLVVQKRGKEKYSELFTDEDKIKAFDLIAEKYYYGNFGTITKSDFDVLMFSIYIEQILKESEDDINKYSDYHLSKLLGITQTRISNLKVKKELLYPYENFDWKKAFIQISKNAVYEPDSNKIKLNIPDKNLYLEIKNAIEEYGGFVDVQLNSRLLQVRLPYFLDLLIAISDERDRVLIKNEIRNKLLKDNKDIEFIEKQPIGKILCDYAPEIIMKLLESYISICSGDVIKLVKNIINVIKMNI